MRVNADDKETVDRMIAEAAETGRMVAAWERIKSLLVTQKLAWMMRLPIEQVGVHPKNRGGEMINPEKVHKLGAKICRLGFSIERAAGACCFEAPADADTYSAACKDNQGLFELSAGLVPQ